VLLQDEDWLLGAPSLAPDEQLTTQLEIAFTRLNGRDFKGDVTTTKNNLLDCNLVVQVLLHPEATSRHLECETPRTGLAHYIARSMLNTGIVNLSRPNHSFALRIIGQNPSEVASNRPVPDPPPTSLPLNHRGPIFFQFLSDHFEANVYVFTSLGKAQTFTPRYPCETTRSVAFLKAADHVQTVVEYLVLGFAIHATPRREPADRTSLATFMDTEHPTPAVYCEHSRPHGGKGKKRDPEWRDLQKSVLISVYEDHW
jgi:hypothetical protein